MDASANASESAKACVDMPTELIDAIARYGGWRAWATCWSRTCKRFDLDWLLQDPRVRHRVTLVPDEAATINAGIAANTDLVLVRPGVYVESVRVTTNVAILGLGAVGAACVRAPGWEPALVWGGFKAGSISATAGRHGARVSIDAASGGADAEIHGLAFEQRNQQQQTAVYITVGQPLIANCQVRGTVHVAGGGAAPRITKCDILGSRSCGVRYLDHSNGLLADCSVARCKLAAVRLAANVGHPTICENRYADNGHDGVLRAGEGDDDEDDDAWVAALLTDWDATELV